MLIQQWRTTDFPAHGQNLSEINLTDNRKNLITKQVWTVKIGKMHRIYYMSVTVARPTRDQLSVLPYLYSLRILQFSFQLYTRQLQRWVAEDGPSAGGMAPA